MSAQEAVELAAVLNHASLVPSSVNFRDCASVSRLLLPRVIFRSSQVISAKEMRLYSVKVRARHASAGPLLVPVRAHRRSS